MDAETDRRRTKKRFDQTLFGESMRICEMRGRDQHKRSDETDSEAM